ncbi:MAG TPA: ABC transporter permease [Acidimicrobiia bacterium]|jgi:spermidine/putrescine transport system permease protein|nr:ABC transporter permease [Acidimicrobiia bacterium]
MTTTLHEPELARLARRRAMVPYLLLLPGMAWLFAFFLVPILRLIGVSLQSGIYPNYEFTWQWDNYARLWTQYGGQVWNSLRFAFIATVICLVLAYPLAYFIAFRGGRWKNFLLVLLLMPFLMPFLLRTLSWKIILADEGLVVGTLKSIGLLGPNATLLATSVSVIAGIAYNFLPFMALPIYVSLEKLDRSLIEAATDLYARPTEAFRKVTLPLSMPGVVAGTLLTFIPAVGDYVNVLLLGSPNEFMIGNVIQSRFLNVLDYPVAAALSFTLMAVIVLMLIPYVRATGTDDLVA